MRYRNGKPTKGARSWEPLSTQYPSEFKTWVGLATRKYDPAYKKYDPLIDEEILWDFECFMQEAGDWFEGASIDRRDNTLGYVKGNIRWATRSEQNSNRSSNGQDKHFYKGKSISQWSKIIGIRRTLIANRLQRGWTIEEAIFVPAVLKGENKRSDQLRARFKDDGVRFSSGEM